MLVEKTAVLEGKNAVLDKHKIDEKTALRGLIRNMRLGRGKALVLANLHHCTITIRLQPEVIIHAYEYQY